MDPIPDEIVRFMQANVETLEQLELLRVLSENPSQEWEIGPLGAQAQADLPAAATHLAALASRGLVTVIIRGSDTLYRHGAGSADLDAKLSQLLQFYKERPVSLIRLVYAQATDRLRAFSDAFRVRKET
jgi:hypothetical protein